MAATALTHPLAGLAEEDLERLAEIADRLLAGRPLTGFGSHAVQRRPGRGVEFLDYREYTAGDDLRRVDWRVSLRCRQPQTRRCQDEATAAWYICLDRSSSMGLPDIDKWSLAVQLAAAWAYLLLRRDNQVGLALFSSQPEACCPLGRGRPHYGQILRLLRAASPRPEGGESALGRCADVVSRYAGIVVISDFLVDDGMQSGLARLAGREIHALQVLSQGELTLPRDVLATLQDVETRRRLTLHTSLQAQGLAAAALSQLQTDLARYCHRHHIPFTTTTTRSTWQETVLNHLRRRHPSRA